MTIPNHRVEIKLLVEKEKDKKKLKDKDALVDGFKDLKPIHVSVIVSNPTYHEHDRLVGVKSSDTTETSNNWYDCTHATRDTCPRFSYTGINKSKFNKFKSLLFELIAKSSQVWGFLMMCKSS